MKTGFFLKLARSNISKNRRFFLPRILSEAGLLCVFYIVFTLRADERILQLRGGQYIEVFMSIGVVVMMLLSVILLFYINSFLMKQRKREFGVYNILGLEKRHICRVLFHETALSSLASVVLGLAIGVLFYKLCSLLICQLLNAEIVLGFYFINARSLALSGAFFLVLDVMAYGVNCVTIARLKPVEMLSSANVGEREPKVKWPLLVLGLLGVRLFIKVIQIKPYILPPIIFVLCILGSYALRNNMFDVGAMLLIAVVGYFFLKLEIPIAPIVLALILGPLAESNLRRSLLLSQGSASIFFTRPICIFFLLLAVLTELFLRNTQFGRNLFLVGGNISVADNLGIKARNYIWSAYIFQGLFAAIGGVVMMTRQFSASGNLALQGPMEVIPMVIVGGTSMAGGRGGALKTVGGVVLLKIIYNAMTMFSIPAPLQPFVKGLILLVVIVSDKYMERRHEKV